MRRYRLLPYFETSAEAAAFLRRGWWCFYFPRFPLFAIFVWLSLPAGESLRNFTPSFTLHWVDLAGYAFAVTVISIPVWAGYKQTYREALNTRPAEDTP